MAKVTFNYAQLKDATAAKQAQESAATIRQLLERSAESAVQIGKLMISVKEVLTPAVFLAWVECEFGWGASVATNYMQAARVFGDLDCLKQFQPTPICTLARKNTPESVVKKAIKLAKDGELITYTVVNQLLKEAGHKPANPSAGKPRKPLLRPVPAQAATFTHVRESLDSLATLLPQIPLELADRQQLMAQLSKLCELAMTLGVTVPPQKAAKSPANPKPRKTAKV